LIRSLKFFLLFFLAGTGMAIAAPRNGAAAGDEPAESPVAEVRNTRAWEMGPFLNWGKGVGDRSDFSFLWSGFEVGKTLTPVLKAGILSGQFQLAGSVMPLWLAYTPAPHIQTFTFQGKTYVAPIGGGTYYGASLMPVIFRWNFLTKSKRIQPWFQGAGGLIYTTHKFPPDVLAPHGMPGGDVSVELLAAGRDRDPLLFALAEVH